MKLPEEFTEKMRVLLREEFPAFLDSYEKEKTRGLRVNDLKLTPEEFERIAPFPAEPIPGMPGAYTFPPEASWARHPYYAAGLYYLQEPSAMLPAFILDVKPGERVLDLCAAPGGKATAIAAKLKGEGLLVANDVSASRAKALLKNLEVFGAPNIFVTNARPEVLSPYFPAYFDHVLVDAPCSGEGMFRKDEAVIRAWTRDKSVQCAGVQRSIILSAADMLRPGGSMIYSTCTFDPREDECVIAHLLRERPGMRLLDVTPMEGFSRGFSEEFLLNAGYPADCPEGADLTKCVRLWPHKSNGEGHFLALLQKAPEPGQAADQTEDRTAGRTADRITGRSADRITGRSADRTAGRMTEGTPAAGRGGMRARKNARTSKASKAGDTSRGQTVRNGAAREFLEEIHAGEGLSAYLVPGEDRSGRIFSPAAAGSYAGLVYLRNGLYLGEEKKGRFEPAQALAMALKAKEYPQRLDLAASDLRLTRYLRGESLGPADLEEFGELKPGWTLVCVNGYPLGWGRLAGGILKNKLHPGWRGEYAGTDRVHTK